MAVLRLVETDSRDYSSILVDVGNVFTDINDAAAKVSAAIVKAEKENPGFKCIEVK